MKYNKDKFLSLVTGNDSGCLDELKLRVEQRKERKLILEAVILIVMHYRKLGVPINKPEVMMRLKTSNEVLDAFMKLTLVEGWEQLVELTKQEYGAAS